MKNLLCYILALASGALLSGCTTIVINNNGVGEIQPARRRYVQSGHVRHYTPPRPPVRMVPQCGYDGHYGGGGVYGGYQPPGYYQPRPRPYGYGRPRPPMQYGGGYDNRQQARAAAFEAHGGRGLYDLAVDGTYIP